MLWDLFAQISLEKVNKTEEAKQLQATLALRKPAQLLQVSIHYKEENKLAAVAR